MKKRLALILAIIMALVIAMPVMAGQRETSAAEPRGYSADGHINAGVKSSDFTVDVHDPALEIDVWGQLWFNAADKYYIANTEDDTFTMGVAVPEGVSLDRCYIQTAYDWWQPVFFTDLPYENGYYIYSGPIDSIYTTGYNFTDVQIYIDQTYNPDGHYPNRIINVYATPDDADSFCSEFDGAGWEYIDEPTEPSVFAVDVHDPALEIDVWGQLWFNAADKYYIANSEDDTFTLGVSIPDGVSLDRCYIQTAYDMWQPVFFTDLPYENGYYIYSGPIDSIYTTGYNFTDVQIYVDQEYNPDEHYPTMIINVYATPDDADSFCSEFEGSGWEYIDDPGEPTPTPEQPTPTPEQPTPTPEQPTPTPEQPTPTPEQPTPTPEQPTPTPEQPAPTPEQPAATPEPEDPPKAGGISFALAGAAIAACGAAGIVIKKRRG